jgi:hypothetical protein
MAVVGEDATAADLALLVLHNGLGPREAAQASYERGGQAGSSAHLPTPEGHSVNGASAIGSVAAPA